MYKYNEAGLFWNPGLNGIKIVAKLLCKGYLKSSGIIFLMRIQNRYPWQRGSLVKTLFAKRRIKFTTYLRWVLAVVFALTAFIFSEVVPDIPPLNRTFLRVTITFWFGLIGFSIFPDLAKLATGYTLSIVNNLISRLSSEMMNQMARLPRNTPFSLPYPQSAPVGGVSVNQPMILDTSAIIDGRILDIVKTSFVYGTILVPTFVLTELQQVADSSDYIKRQRGRRGFEIIDELKKVKSIRIEIWDKEISSKTVDDKLIKLAKSLHGKIITTDYNLNRVATLSNITVLNINDLANSVKTIAVPGEFIKIKVVHLGKDPKQGVGYLPDGTMIVVEDGAELVGKDTQVEVSRILQVPAGRMVFTKTVK